MLFAPVAFAVRIIRSWKERGKFAPTQRVWLSAHVATGRLVIVPWSLAV